MTIAVPLEAAAIIRGCLDRGVMLPEDSSALERVLAFVERFEPKGLPAMTTEVVAGEMREIRLVDPTLEAESFDLIRLNRRTFVPETIEVVDEVEEYHRAGIAELRLDEGALSDRLIRHADMIGRAGLWHASQGSMFGKSLDGGSLAQLLREAYRAVTSAGKYTAEQRLTAITTLSAMSGDDASGEPLADIVDAILAVVGLKAVEA